MESSIGIYIHIPFCIRKCIYCDFVSYTNVMSMQYSYVDALLGEMALYQYQMQNQLVSSIFIGGGTPSLMDVDCIDRILQSVYKGFKTDVDAEVTIEVNPGTVTLNKLKAYKAMGINRLSIGLQAWQDELLKSIGRIHTADDFLSTYRWAVSAGFNNINVDLIFGLPGQTLRQWLDTLKAVTALEPMHVSCYALQIEKGTLLYQMIQSGDVVPADDDLDRLMYHQGTAFLRAMGYGRYEVSNFARPGFECKHNWNYWSNGYYLGFGCAAHSHMDNKRWGNMPLLDKYIEAVTLGHRPLAFEEELEEEIIMFETIMLGLRTAKGVNKNAFYERFGISLKERYGYVIDKLLQEKLVYDDIESIKVTDKGLDLLNDVLIEFLP